MAMFSRQFGRPRGIAGRVVGRMMARSNADFNKWFIHELQGLSTGHPRRIVELGPGPGIGLQETLLAFPNAQVWGIDLSPEMLSQSRKRNLEEINSGRLVLLEGDALSIQPLAPIDLVFASHVLYFWHEPASVLAQLRQALNAGGLLALGYQLKANMPQLAQKNFPKEGHLLYETDEEISVLLAGAGFTGVRFLVKGDPAAPEGRLALATV